MSERTRNGVRILEVAVLFGICANVNLRVAPWGINLLLTAGVLVWGLYRLARRVGDTLLSSESATPNAAASATLDDSIDAHARLSLVARRWLLPLVVVFAACFAWRDSDVLRLLDLASVCLLFALVMMESRRVRVSAAGLIQYATATVRAAFQTWFGAFGLVCQDIKWRELRRTPNGVWGRHLAAVARGVLLLLPLAFVFLMLFMAADAIFSRLVSDSFGFDGGEAASHIILTLFFAWLAAGFLRGVFIGDFAETSRALPQSTLSSKAGEVKVESDIVKTDERQTKNDEVKVDEVKPHVGFRLGTIEISIVLGALNLIFLLFVLVQIRYLFGGAERVIETVGLTYAEYARRGFFELVWVAGLVLALLLVVHHFLRAEDKLCARVFRVFSSSLVALVFIITMSAVKRMMLYQSEYGLTELRVYTTTFMAWLALMLAWFVWTVLVKNKRRRFAVGALASALGVVFALHVVNPDALIARVNLARIEAGKSFDDEYVINSLSLDAVPELWRERARLQTPAQRLSFIVKMRDERERLSEMDWRSWSVARGRAKNLFEREAESLIDETNLSGASELPAYQY